MLKESALRHYLEGDHNCAEAMLLAIREVYGLDIPQDSLRLVSGFGGGLACEKTCGALLGSIAGLGALTVQDRAHATDGFSEQVAALVARFVDQLGSDQCAHLKPRFAEEEQRCAALVAQAAQLFEAQMPPPGGEPTP